MQFSQASISLQFHKTEKPPKPETLIPIPPGTRLTEPPPPPEPVVCGACGITFSSCGKISLEGNVVWETFINSACKVLLSLTGVSNWNKLEGARIASNRQFVSWSVHSPSFQSTASWVLLGGDSANCPSLLKKNVEWDSRFFFSCLSKYSALSLRLWVRLQEWTLIHFFRRYLCSNQVTNSRKANRKKIGN